MKRTCVRVENGVVMQSIVGDVSWANEWLDGEWHDTTGLTVGKGYTLVDGEFRYPQTYPSWLWQNGEWHAPHPQPEPSEEGTWDWDEDAQNWATVNPISEQGED